MSKYEFIMATKTNRIIGDIVCAHRLLHLLRISALDIICKIHRVPPLLLFLFLLLLLLL